MKRGFIKDAKTLAEIWEYYREAVLPDDASPTQVLNTSHAFYNGAGAVFTFLHDLGKGRTPNQSMALLDSVFREVMAFNDRIAEEIAAGRALGEKPGRGRGRQGEPNEN